jgi:hypothetical protein
VDRQLALQLGYPLTRRDQLGLIAAGQSRNLAGVDQLLPPPRVDDLRADVQVLRHLRDRLAGLYQIQDLPPELSRIPLRDSVLRRLLDE